MTLPTQALAGDVRSLEALRSKAASDPKAAVREAAKAFETLFMQELMKSMRSASMNSGLLENEGTQLGGELLDQQYATRLSGMPGGLSDLIARQLERQMGLAPGPIPSTARANPVPAPLKTEGDPAAAVRLPQKAAAAFVQQHEQAARQAQASTGIPAEFMISQAALETGWGRREIRHADGSTAHNLFGIKAGPGWRGPVAEVTTTEYINGQPQKVTARFRAYGSYAESFADYARLMQNNPRYAGVLAQGGSASGFAQNLQRAGYATDPAYAEKLTRVINTTLRLQRSLT
ncbi:MAG: flagellar assembly peptidoglycan hydrolase FlgJ [Rubrivivax sp.]|nr:flagellar assembly peptidoglycan hydrolase FlgJ [Rubrivivax sp.]